VKGSRGVGLERVAEALGAGSESAEEHPGDASVLARSTGPGQH
jgi:hypothetical protein